MDKYSDYDFPRQGINQPERRRDRRNLWLVLLGMVAVPALLCRPETDFATIPLMIGLCIFAVWDSSALYFALPQHAPSPPAVEQEMTWLFGESWKSHASREEIAFARSRIQRRRLQRWQFGINLITFLGAAGFMGYLLSLLTAPPEPIWAGDFLVMLTWLTIVVRHGIIALPSREHLARRERQIGQAILAEMQHSTPDIGSQDKPKNDVQYRIAEDGELEAVDYEPPIGEDEKPKRSASD